MNILNNNILTIFERKQTLTYMCKRNFPKSCGQHFTRTIIYVLPTIQWKNRHVLWLNCTNIVHIWQKKDIAMQTQLGNICWRRTRENYFTP